MAIPKEISKEIQLNLNDVPRSQRTKAKDEIGEFVVGEILDQLSKGRSPVSGESFKRLSKEYADSKKGGDITPNLELEGDLLNALEYKRTKDGIKVGIFKSSELGKADGHNNFSGESKLPKRRFIPDEGQSFKRQINSGVKKFIEEYKRPDKQETSEQKQVREFIENLPGVATTISIDDLFEDIL